MFYNSTAPTTTVKATTAHLTTEKLTTTQPTTQKETTTLQKETTKQATGIKETSNQEAASTMVATSIGHSTATQTINDVKSSNPVISTNGIGIATMRGTTTRKNSDKSCVSQSECAAKIQDQLSVNLFLFCYFKLRTHVLSTSIV